ncbi:hypothetical protein [Streptomyces anthocyanicus]|uniref:hypothetical protein n=1 Tax=Streptomyces anthocyanicus TaxID=68174 RepID=UPI002F911073|nr:hypothetical protein OHA15_39375 [Streptomyces anthocyanicus]
MVGQSYRERVDEALRSGGSETALDLAVAALETSCGDLLTEWGEAVECLGGQSAALRACLLGALPDRYRRAPLGSASALGLLHLSAVLNRGLTTDVLVAERRAAVAGIGDLWVCRDHALLHLAHTELYGGWALPPQTVATVRRSAALVEDPGWKTLAVQLAQPVLNVGEHWADTALADVAESRPGWVRLLAHAASVRALPPTVTWERRARDLLTDIGAAAVRERLLCWLGLVGLPRTHMVTGAGNFGPQWTNVRFDPFNADALRGVVWLLALMDPDEGSTLALGALADVALRVAPGQGPLKVANAAVRVLSRLESDTALAELRRLSRRAAHGSTLRLINNVLTASRTDDV